MDEKRGTTLHGMRTKEEVKYESKATGMDDCDECKSFVGPNRCKKVAGEISPDGWCHLFILHPGAQEKTKEVL
jgi:hypothetical protein